MCPWVEVCGKYIPGYGMCIALGILIANAIACFLIDESQRLDLFILEGYCLLGGMLGAKILYILVSIDLIDWNRWNDLNYVISIFKGGFVFYGGLFGGMIGFFLAEKIHGIEGLQILKRVFFCVPLAHGFGRVGCFMAGCCYGIPYKGIFAVTYPEVSFGPSGMACFPIQLFEALLLWLLSLIVYVVSVRKRNPIWIYLLGYAVIRFVLEYLRGDVERGSMGILSTSQWISVCIILAVIGIGCWERTVKKKR